MTEAIIDAHHHIWELKRIPWLQGPIQPRIFGEYSGLKRDYLGTEFKNDLQRHGITQSVYIQINVAPGDEIAETEWVQKNADAHGIMQGIVAYANLSDPNVGAVLDQHLKYANLRGIRQQIHWHENAQYRFALRPDLMNDTTWRNGLAEMQKRGLTFDLQVFPSQMADAARLAHDFPGMKFALLHAGMLQDRSAAGWALWRRGMKELADCPNMWVKLSGLGTFVRACSVALWKPVIDETVELFGPERCMYGSNYPIESLWTSYANIFDTTQACLGGLSSAERRQVFHEVAAGFYRLK
ncbi:MAG TPA: amidohydrolase family protein [Burkholderiales bacterium]|nr:amidohydrolase family protein [Burkholderiales bacterium]